MTNLRPFSPCDTTKIERHEVVAQLCLHPLAAYQQSLSRMELSSFDEAGT